MSLLVGDYRFWYKVQSFVNKQVNLRDRKYSGTEINDGSGSQVLGRL